MEIDKNYILRLYAVHEKTMGAAHDLNAGLALCNLTPDDLTRIANDLDFLTDQLEKIFAETLSDEERGIPSDEEFAKMVNELVGRE
jgi:hypothetical protein